MLNSLIRNTFRKSEKICNQKQIDTLFASGKSYTSGLFRLIYLETEPGELPPVQVLIAVPKKNLRNAVDRNRMKRLIREAYRLSKHNISNVLAKAGKHYNIAFVFMGKNCVSQSETSAAIIVLLNRLIQIHEKNSE
jgi:ribonuclease P protein component